MLQAKSEGHLLENPLFLGEPGLYGTVGLRLIRRGPPMLGRALFFTMPIDATLLSPNKNT